jgi:thioredoxin reductase (NADPH)
MQQPEIQNKQADILIIGGGPAGLTAAVYGARAGVETVLLKGRGGSRLSIGYELENYPGFVSINSLDLLKKMEDHARHFGAEIRQEEAIDFNLSTQPKFATTSKTLFQAKAVIVATGKSLPKSRLIEGEETLLGKGVSYCAVCDGPIFRNKTVAAVGRSEDAAEDILTLRQMGCKVHWFPGGSLKISDETMSKIREADVDLHEKTGIKKINGEQRVENIVFDEDGSKKELDVAGVFILREQASASLFNKAGLQLDSRQCVVVDRFQRTNLDGVFAAGDVTCGGLQVVSAAGEGATAGMQAVKYIRDLKK